MEVALQHLAAWPTLEGARIAWASNITRTAHYTASSQVTITLTNKDGQTKLDLVQTGVPEDEKERTEKGWNGLLFDRLKAMLGGSVAR